jgi:hypothetical protein
MSNKIRYQDNPGKQYTECKYQHIDSMEILGPILFALFLGAFLAQAFSLYDREFSLNDSQNRYVIYRMLTSFCILLYGLIWAFYHWEYYKIALKPYLIDTPLLRFVNLMYITSTVILISAMYIFPHLAFGGIIIYSCLHVLRIFDLSIQFGYKIYPIKRGSMNWLKRYYIKRSLNTIKMNPIELDQLAIGRVSVQWKAEYFWLPTLFLVGLILVPYILSLQNISFTDYLEWHYRYLANVIVVAVMIFYWLINITLKMDNIKINVEDEQKQFRSIIASEISKLKEAKENRTDEMLNAYLKLLK